MDVAVLKKIKKNPTVIEGFPGFGLVGSIVTEFLIDHLACEKLDAHYFTELPANVAIHEGKLIDPISLYYNQHFNILIFHSIIPVQGLEWKAADLVIDACKTVKAKELICIEGVGSGTKSKERIFYYANETKRANELSVKGLTPMKEGIIMGPTAAVLMKNEIKATCLFGETASSMPDNKTAARIIELLDELLGLNVDPRPLIESAKALEDKFKQIFGQMQDAGEEKDKKIMSYVG